MSNHIGLLFGTFNPIHKGHIALGKYFTAHTAIDTVWYVISPQSPFKVQETILDNHTRLEMVAAALQDEALLHPSTVEFKLPQPNYTVNTLELLRTNYPENTFTLLMGADNMARFEEWQGYETILQEHEIFVYPREDFNPKGLLKHPKIQFMDAPKMEVSSTTIKAHREQPQKLLKWLPEAVIKIIDQKNLYL